VAFDEARGGMAMRCGLAWVLVAPAALTLTHCDGGLVLAENADLGMRSEDFAIRIAPTQFEARHHQPDPGPSRSDIVSSEKLTQGRVPA
jgi:hypothetical protein